MDPSASYIADRENEACKRCIYIYIYICIYIDIDGKSVFRFFPQYSARYIEVERDIYNVQHAPYVTRVYCFIKD